MMSIPRSSRTGVAIAVAVVSGGATACGPTCPPTYTAGSNPVAIGVSYPDTCSRSADGAVDFDGQYWVAPSPAATNALTALHACVQSRYGPSPEPSAPPATLTLVDEGHVRWSDFMSTYALVSAGRTQPARCG